MEEIFNNLKKFEKHVELIKANKNTLSSVQKIFNCRIPANLESWYKVFNGGYVFSTNFFSTKTKIDGRPNKLTLKDVNSKKWKTQNQLPEDIVCFAQTNYGNYYCFATNESDDCVYEWDLEEGGLILVWKTFKEFMLELIANAEEDLRLGNLD